MSNYANTKATIAANVYTNHANQVTAEMVKTAINVVVDTIIAGGFLYKGVAIPSTNPGSPDANVAYIATTPGIYTNFGSLVVADGEVAVLKYNGSWTKEVTGAATAAQVSALGQEVGEIGFDVYGVVSGIGTIKAPNQHEIVVAGLNLQKGVTYHLLVTAASAFASTLQIKFYDSTDTEIYSTTIATGNLSRDAYPVFSADYTNARIEIYVTSGVANIGKSASVSFTKNEGGILGIVNRERQVFGGVQLLRIVGKDGGSKYQTFSTLVGRTYRIYLSSKAEWDISNITPLDSRAVFAVDYYDSVTNSWKNAIGFSLAQFADLPDYVDYTAVDTQARVLIRCNAGDALIFEVSDTSDKPIRFEAENKASKQDVANAFLFPESDGTSETEAVKLPTTGSMCFSFIPIEATPQKRTIFSNSDGSFLFNVETDGTAYMKFNGSYLRPRIELVQGQIFTFDISWDGSALTLSSGNYSGSIAYSTPMSETIKMYSPGAEYPLLSAQWLEASLNGNSFVFSKNFKFHKSRELGGASDTAVSLAVAAQSLYKPMRGVLFHHLNVEAAAADTTIPSQSLLDVRYAKALGFDFIEANIQKCSDDVLVVKHGASGLLGAGVKLIGGGDCSTTAFSSVTSTWLRENVVYDSVIQKYCTSIPTFDEFCKACREESIGILIAGYSLAADALAVARKYLPDNMLMVAGLSVRGDFKGIINGWWDIASTDDAVAKLEQYGRPFVLGWRNYASASTALKEAVVLEMHKRGALVGTAYLNPAEVEVAKGFGVDVIASTKNEINPFNLGGLHNIHKLNDPALTFSSGAVYDSATNTIQMAAGSYLYLPNTDHSGGIVKMSVSIRYIGTLTIQPGTSSEPTEIKQYASDGNGFVSAGFAVERRANILRLAADTAVTIYDWSICASVVF